MPSYFFHLYFFFRVLSTRFSSQSEPVPFEPPKNSAKQAIFFLPFFCTKWTQDKTNRKQVTFLEYLLIFWNVAFSLKNRISHPQQTMYYHYVFVTVDISYCTFYVQTWCRMKFLIPPKVTLGSVRTIRVPLNNKNR